MCFLCSRDAPVTPAIAPVTPAIAPVTPAIPAGIAPSPTIPTGTRRDAATAAAFRHLLAYLRDPSGVDCERGISHLAHLACNIAFLLELEKTEGA